LLKALNFSSGEAAIQKQIEQLERGRPGPAAIEITKVNLSESEHRKW
jgi:hypothetical protein